VKTEWFGNAGQASSREFQRKWASADMRESEFESASQQQNERAQSSSGECEQVLESERVLLNAR